MYKPTSNPYSFKYLITGITGPGIEQFFLPPVPSEDKILFKKEQKFVRPEMPDFLKSAVKEMLYERSRKDSKGNFIDPEWTHPKYQRQINDWEDQEWERCKDGVWFWNNGVPTYLTPFYYWYLSSWRTYFGIPQYRETDKELTYFLMYVEEDPNCFGGTFNTIRRYGKSVIMGAWATHRTTRNYNHFCGMQGETDDKIKKFYNKFIKKPFYKLPYYHQPTYNTATQQTNQIEFDIPPKRNKKHTVIDEVDSLESIIEYRESSEGAYDGDILNTYLCEEPGKVKKVSIYNEEGEGRWDVVVPCLMDGLEIIGKAFFGTTVENLNMRDKGGQAYKNLFYDSDFNQKHEDGRTRSGMYACFLPGDCALKGFWDEWGHPKREEARDKLLQTRKKFQKNANKLAGHIRKYPLTIREIFYVNPTGCEFNATVLQNRRDDIDMSSVPMYEKFELRWENNIRFSRIICRHNPAAGWLKCSWIPKDEKETNLVGEKNIGGEKFYYPMNDSKFACGMDPIDHGVSTEGRSATGEDSVQGGGKRSTPVVLVKTKYDVALDGPINPDIMILKSEPGKMVGDVWTPDENGKKYQYQSNQYFLMMDTRPNDPNVLYERTLMICWWLGVSLHVETQKPGVIRYFQANNCNDFLLNKYIPVESSRSRTLGDEGTAASTTIIQDYTSLLATYVEYFGHQIPFRELIEDLLLFNPRNTREYDYSVSMGFTEMATLIKPKQKPKTYIDISQIMPMMDEYGSPLN